jgi:hypothetical protein
MEATLDLDVLSKSSTEEIVAEKSTEELDDILDEVVNLAKPVESQKPVLHNIVSDGEEAAEETDFAMQTGDYLELDINLPREATESQTKKTPLAEETTSAFDALIDAENEVMDSLAKESAANDAQDASLTVTGKDSESKDTVKGLAEDSNTLEKGVCDALPAHSEKSSEDYLVDQESESEVEAVSAPVCETSIPQGSTDQLADLLSKKIEITISRLIEEQLSVAVERMVTEKLERILVNIT